MSSCLESKFDKKFQWEVSQIANNRFPLMMLLGGLSVNVNHLKTTEGAGRKTATVHRRNTQTSEHTIHWTTGTDTTTTSCIRSQESDRRWTAESHTEVSGHCKQQDRGHRRHSHCQARTPKQSDRGRTPHEWMAGTLQQRGRRWVFALF